MTDSVLAEIPSELIRTAVLETIENQLNSRDFDIELTSASKCGENNFIGVIYRISFSRKIEENSKTYLIVKVAPQNLLRRSQFVVRPAFEREIYSYEKVNKILMKFKDETLFQS